MSYQTILPCSAHHSPFFPGHYNHFDSWCTKFIRNCQPTTTTTTKTTSTSNFSPFSRVFSLSSRTTSNHSHVNPVSAVKHTRPKPTPYDPFAYHPGVYDTQDFIHTDILPEAKSKFPFRFKLTLPNPFRFRTHPRSPVSPWPPDSPLRDTSSPPHTATTAGTSRANSPARPRKGRTAADYGDNDPSSSHWRWSSFESLEPSHLKLKRWFSVSPAL